MLTDNRGNDSQNCPGTQDLQEFERVVFPGGIPDQAEIFTAWAEEQNDTHTERLITLTKKHFYSLTTQSISIL